MRKIILCLMPFMVCHISACIDGAERATIPYTTENRVPDFHLVIVAYQDYSGSRDTTGVEIINLNVFNPYFKNTRLAIDLYFGLITDHSAGKLIHLELRPFSFERPTPPNVTRMSVTEETRAKQAYTQGVANYEADSISYSTDRANTIQDFRRCCDSLLQSKKGHEAGYTDIATAVRVADKVFNGSTPDCTNFLILNSDGKDSYVASVPKLHNTGQIILVNAHGLDHTSVDSAATIQLESPELAIEYTLREITLKTQNHENN